MPQFNSLFCVFSVSSRVFVSDLIGIFQDAYCRFIIFVGFLTFRYAYPWPTEWHLAKALLMSLPLGYSLFIIKTCGRGRKRRKWIYGFCSKAPVLLMNIWSWKKRPTSDV